MAEGREVAAFDVDGTLTDADTFVPYLAAVAGWPRVAAAVPWAVVRSFGDRDEAKARLVRAALRGVPVERLAATGEETAARVVARRLRPRVIARLRWHLEAGHTVVLVSASLRPFLDPLARTIEAHAVVCTELHLAGGTATGRLEGPNCRGVEKVQRLAAWMGPGDRLVAAYGDAGSDAPLLAAAEEGWWVRGGRLERAAR